MSPVLLEPDALVVVNVNDACLDFVIAFKKDTELFGFIC